MEEGGMKFQLVRWFPEWKGFGFRRLSIYKTGMALIFEWIIWFGFWEIRKWVNENKRKGLLDEYNKGEAKQ
jgi:hypothetical protein